MDDLERLPAGYGVWWVVVLRFKVHGMHREQTLVLAHLKSS